ncbi:MAG: molybdopterin molybdotransferase MoeA, partial [Bacteroidales bacterium]|nr:molybdopterin molybdotransferase MoeA [Bacteroidales bacterium]
AEDVKSDIDMPPFDKSSVDGYACRAADLKNELTLIEIIAAGTIPNKEILENQCSKIMTGAMLPKGADAVIMVEDTETTDNKHIKYLKEYSKSNIAYEAEDIKKGDIVLKKGTLIKAHHIAVLAEVGKTEIEVYKQPKIAVIPTGDELVEPEIKPKNTQIRNSNGAQMIAQIQEIGIPVNYIGIAKDTENDTFNKIKKAIDENDIILLSGGVSMGDFDIVPKIIENFGFETLFHNVAVQPGKPTLFSRKGNKFIFGLPGNPVSSFMQLNLLVKPFIFNMMGYKFVPKNIKMPLEKDYTRKNPNRMSWIPVVLTENGTILPIEYHGSAHLNSIAYADGFIAIPVGVNTLKKGEIIHVRQI